MCEDDWFQDERLLRAKHRAIKPMPSNAHVEGSGIPAPAKMGVSGRDSYAQSRAHAGGFR
jgi:hypothetical protein